MKELSVFKIYKKEIIWKTEVEEECNFVDLGAVKKESEAMDIVDTLNKENKNLEFSYFYKRIDLALYKDKDEFFGDHYNRNITF